MFQAVKSSKALAAVFALAVLFPAPLPAATASCDEAPAVGKPHRPAHSCAADSKPDILFTLAQVCEKDLAGNPSCRAARKNYVILKDNSPCKPKGYLLIPARCVTGVEDSQVLSEPVVNFWDDAWRWSLKELAPLPASRLGLAVNSLGTRGNDQLHFHISCVNREVRKTLRQKDKDIPVYSEYSPASSKPLRIELGARRHAYDVVKVPVLAGENSPFEVVEKMRGGSQAAMAKQGIAVVAARRRGGYYVLDTSEDAGGGHAEELLDQRCR